MQSNRQLLAIVPLILAAIVGGCVGVVTSPSPLAQTPKIGELPVTQTPARDLAQSPITLNGGESVSVLCDGGRIASARVSKNQVVVLCVGASVTVTPTVTAVPPTLTLTPVPPTRTLTPIPPTITATRTSTPVPPTRTPAPPTPTRPPTATPVPGVGHTYYVGTAGDDAWPGTLSQPFRTIQHAVDLMTGGDTTYVLAGTYNERVNFWYKGNTAGPYMTLTSFPNAKVIIDGTNIPIEHSEGLVHIQRTDYVRISGLRVQNVNGAGIETVAANYVEISNNQTYDTARSGVSTWWSSHILIDGNDIALACNAHPNYAAAEENISIAAESTDIEVKNNYVHKASNIPDGYAGGEGINVKDGSHNVKVHHNTVRLDERPDGKPSNRLAFGIDAWNSAVPVSNVEIYNNLAYNTLQGFIVSSEQGGAVDGVKIYNNIAYNIAQAGFEIIWHTGTVDGIKRNVQFVNNTSFGNGYGFFSNSPTNENIVLRNNIFAGNKVAIDLLPSTEGQFTVDHNLTSGDPLFANPATADFHLQAGSPAIDAGSATGAPGSDYDGKARPRGAGFDIGAFEN